MSCAGCGAALPAEARFCPACGRARAGTIALQAERRPVTVLFADISGFTALAERLDPEDVRETINACLRGLVAVVHEYGGTVDKFIGDAVMALFGAPLAREDDAERALAAALAMRERLAEVAAGFAGRLPAALSLHIGINTGLVVAGAVGSVAHSQYTVLGDAVNVAARLEDLSTDGQILVAESTRRLTAHAFSFTDLPPAALKGKTAPVAVHELRGRRAAPRDTRGLADLQTPLLGRDLELATLIDALDELSAGRGGYVALEGAAGAGKSRLLRELREAARGRGIAWVQAEASNLDQGRPLLIWSVAVRRLLALAGGQGTVIRPARSGRTEIAPLRPDAGGALRRSLGIGPAAAAHADAGDERVAARPVILDALRDLIAARARTAPLVLALEDLHWADGDSLALLDAVADLTTTVPLLIVSTRRDDAVVAGGVSGAEEATPAVRLALAPLDDAASRRLAAAIVGEGGAAAPIAAVLAEHADGNPLYLEETFRALVDQGVLVRGAEGGWRPAAEATQIVLPPTLHGLLLDRIDRLPDAAKSVLHLAAVAGRTFPRALIARLAGPAAGGELAALSRLGFLEAAADPGMLRFRHALLHEAAYSAQLRRRRRDLHRQLAEAIVAAPGLWPGLAQQPAVLARHWQRAEAWPEAARWGLRAAEVARRADAGADAARLAAEALAALDRAAALPASDGERAELAELRGEALIALAGAAHRAGRLDEARTHLRAVLGATPDRQAGRAIAARCRLALVAISAGHIEAAVAVAAEALASARIGGDVWLIRLAGGVYGRSLAGVGRHIEADAELGAAVEAARAVGEGAELAAALGAWAAVRAALGDAAGALALREERARLLAASPVDGNEVGAIEQSAP